MSLIMGDASFCKIRRRRQRCVPDEDAKMMQRAAERCVDSLKNKLHFFAAAAAGGVARLLKGKAL